MQPHLTLDRLLNPLLHAGGWLRAVGTEALVAHLARACFILGDDQHGLMREHRDALAHATGLSAPMVDWAASTSVAPYSSPTRLADELGLTRTSSRRSENAPERITVPSRLCTVVLGGNVPTAVLRATIFPLMTRAPVLVKTSPEDRHLPDLWKQALTQSSPELGACIEVVDRASIRAPVDEWMPYVLERSDAVHVYGSDAAVRAVADRTPASTLFGAHGHGLGVALLSASALRTEAAARNAASAVALDVAAYDQRGCLSPHAVWLCATDESSGHFGARAPAVPPQQWAQWLHEALTRLDAELPAGTCALPAQAQRAQWRGVARATGMLWEGAGHAVAFCESSSSVPMVGPGHRHVWVTTCESTNTFLKAITPLGLHLKVIGVGPGPADPTDQAGQNEGASLSQSLLQQLPPPLCPRVCAIGSMQTPPLSAVWDGEDPWAQLTRFKSHQ